MRLGARQIVSADAADSLFRDRGLHLDEYGVINSHRKSSRRRSRMYAAIVKLRIDPAKAPAAAAAFTNDILPRVTSVEGFMRGYWLDLDPVDAEGLGFVLFDTAEHANRVTPPRFDWSAPGVTIIGVNVQRVAVAVPEPGIG